MISLENMGKSSNKYLNFAFGKADAWKSKRGDLQKVIMEHAF
jgi:hypothetical protein